jgi:alpha-D-ribose 1-methylphosphonate 5-triphosphate synthase subunit PhnL
MEKVVEQLETCLDTTPHIFLVGFSGTGKTTLAKEFLAAYFKKVGVSKAEEKDYCIEISSHQDRGIFTIRETLFDFVAEFNYSCRANMVAFVLSLFR